MIISHKHKFIFIKTKKTAGTSIEIALSKICGKEDIIAPISKLDEKFRQEYANISAQNFFLPFNKYTTLNICEAFLLRKRLIYYNHMPCREIKAYISKEVWDSYYKFTLDRNPFDKMVSLYYWRKGDKKFGNIYDFLKNGGLDGFTSYDIYAIDGVVAVDQVYQFEDLKGMCLDLTKRFKLPELLELPRFKAKSNTRKVKNYKELLDEKSIELIKTIFAREIKLFGYTY